METDGYTSWVLSVSVWMTKKTWVQDQWKIHIEQNTPQSRQLSYHKQSIERGSQMQFYSEAFFLCSILQRQAQGFWLPQVIISRDFN